MKKIFFLILLLVLIVGCTSPKVVQESDIQQQTTPDSVVIIEDSEPSNDLGALTGNSVIDIVETNKENFANDDFPILDSKIQKLVDSARKINKYSYKARYPEDSERRFIEVKISDNKMKITFPEQEFIFKKDYFDTIYLDTNTKEAIAYCESESRCKERNIGYVVDYDMFLVKTPVDWTLDLLEVDSPQIIGNEFSHGRSLTVVEYELNNVLMRQSITDRYGTSKVYTDYGPNVKVTDFEFTGANFGEDEMIHQREN